MSRVKSYGCDCCGIIQPESAMVGVSDIQDLFDMMSSYPTIMNPDKAKIHYCTTCYGARILIPVRTEVDRKKNEELYRLKMKELTYQLRRLCVQNWQEKKFFKHLD